MNKNILGGGQMGKTTVMFLSNLPPRGFFHLGWCISCFFPLIINNLYIAVWQWQCFFFVGGTFVSKTYQGSTLCTESRLVNIIWQLKNKIIGKVMDKINHDVQSGLLPSLVWILCKIGVVKILSLTWIGANTKQFCCWRKLAKTVRRRRSLPDVTAWFWTSQDFVGDEISSNACGDESRSLERFYNSRQCFVIIPCLSTRFKFMVVVAAAHSTQRLVVGLCPIVWPHPFSK